MIKRPKFCLRGRKTTYYYGFTLVELVMVIVIIGFLTAIIIPKYTSQRENAAQSSTKANLESLRTAVALFYAEEGVYPDTTLMELVNGKLIQGGGRDLLS